MRPPFRGLWIAVLVILCPALICWASGLAGQALMGPDPDGSSPAHWLGWAVRVVGVILALFSLGGLSASAMGGSHE